MITVKHLQKCSDFDILFSDSSMCQLYLISITDNEQAD